MNIYRIINEEVIKTLNEAFKAPRDGILELGLTAVSKKRKYIPSIMGFDTEKLCLHWWLQNL